MRRRIFMQSLAGTAGALLVAPHYLLQAGAGERRTGLVYSERFLDHVIKPQHPESPRRLETLKEYFDRLDLFERTVALEPLPHPGPALEAVHSAEHIAAIKQRYPISHEVALMASGGAVAAVDAVMAGDVDNAFCASRPPGHHARNTGREEGFCYYNHIAVAARHLQREHGLQRILIVDWDYHHGDGTEEAFYADPGVLFFSTHDGDAYPGTGHARRTGEGPGEGYNINVPMPCGTDDADIIKAFEEKLLPAAAAYKPQFILVSAGFDSRVSDLLGCFHITDRGYERLTQMLLELAAQHSGGRIVSILEGGYNLKGNASASAAHVSSLLGDQ